MTDNENVFGSTSKIPRLTKSQLAALAEPPAVYFEVDEGTTEEPVHPEIGRTYRQLFREAIELVEHAQDREADAIDDMLNAQAALNHLQRSAEALVEQLDQCGVAAIEELSNLGWSWDGQSWNSPA